MIKAIKKCWIKDNNINCLNQTNDIRLCIECRIWKNKYQKYI